MWKRPLITLLIFALFLSTTPAAKATLPYSSNNAKNAGVIIGVVAAVAGIGFLVYYSVHHGHSLRGCAVSGPGGLQLVNKGDQQTYDLVGETAVIKPGDQVRVSGKKTKHDPNHKQFVVTKLAKDYGACQAKTATP